MMTLGCKLGSVVFYAVGPGHLNEAMMIFVFLASLFFFFFFTLQLLIRVVCWWVALFSSTAFGV